MRIESRFWLIVFQIINWSGGMLLYSALLYTASVQKASEIFAAEVLLGVAGVFFATLFLRAHLSNESAKLLKYARFVRLMVFLVLNILFLGKHVTLDIYFAALAVLFTPVHLPILFGFTIYHSIFAGYKILGAFLIYEKIIPKTIDIAYIYFVPTIFYGVSIWIYEYLRDKRPINSDVTPLNKNYSIVAQLFVTLTGCWVQSLAIPSIVNVGPSFALLERVMRSTISFLYPHFILRIFKSSNADFAIMTACFVVVFFNAIFTEADGVFFALFLFLIPSTVDVVNSVLAGKSRIRDIFLGLGFGLICWMNYV